MTKTVFAVRVITKDVITDAFARFRSIIGGRVRAYELAIQEGLEDCYHELLLKFPDVKNIRFNSVEVQADAAELVLYGEVSDEDYKQYVLNKMNKKKDKKNNAI